MLLHNFSSGILYNNICKINIAFAPWTSCENQPRMKDCYSVSYASIITPSKPPCANRLLGNAIVAYVYDLKAPEMSDCGEIRLDSMHSADRLLTD